MLLLKGFFRKKTTKIYLLVISVLLIALLTFFAFFNYYVGLLNNIVPYSQILIVSKTDIYENLNKSDNYISVEKAIVFKPDYNYKVLVRECKTLSDDCDYNSLSWENMNMFSGSEYIVVFPSSRNDMKLDDNKIVIGFGKSITETIDIKTLNKLKNKKIGFYNGNKKQEFEIENHYDTNFTEVLISDNKFQELYKTSDIYAYIGKVKDERMGFASEDLNKSNGIEHTIIFQSFSSSDDYDVWKNLKDLISWLTVINYVMIFMFSIVILIVLRNTLIDEYKNVHHERLLGYNKNQVRKYLF